MVAGALNETQWHACRTSRPEHRHQAMRDGAVFTPAGRSA